MSGESDSDFVKSVEELLKTGQTTEANSICNATEYATKVKDNSWDLIPVLSKYLLTPTQDGNMDVEIFECCKQLLNYIADISNPEEALLQFIEEFEESDSDIKFILLLDPLTKILKRITKKRLISLSWVFNAVHNYLQKCPVPECEKLEGKEKLLLDNSIEIKNINKLYVNLIKFYKHLADDYSGNNKDIEEITIKLEFLIRLLGSPLVYVDVEVFDGIKGKARIISENLVDQIFKICRDPTAILESNKNNVDGIYKICDLGLASLYYLVFAEGICISQTPKVYNAVYFFQSCLYLVTILLKVQHQIVIEKGLKLAMHLFHHISHTKLPYCLLDSETHEEFCKAVCDIIVYNDVASLRKLGIEVYKRYLFLFDTRGFYCLIYYLITELNHSGLRGFTITLYKDLLARELNGNNVNKLSFYVKGNKLLMLLKKICFLNNKEKSDLVEISDEVIATLNLLRYLVIRDSHNETNIWDFIPIINELYFHPLKNGIDISRAHYKQKIEQIQQENTKLLTNSHMDILINGDDISRLSKEEKMQVLNSSLTVFDILDSLLSRVKECIEGKNY